MPILPRAFAIVYTLLWCLAGPWLLLSRRLRQGWRQRLGLDLPGPCEVWIQGASAGECHLVRQLLPGLADLSVLATTCTLQGREVLESVVSSTPFHPRMLPLDLPLLMGRVLDRIRPKVVVLLETELWPGLLLACAARNVPVIVINGRMSTRSLPGYLWLGALLRICPPAAVGAIAPADARRYDTVFGSGTAVVTGNIKFDRLLHTSRLEQTDNPLAWLVPQNAPFVVLGSVREEEEEQILELIRLLRQREPRVVIGLVPRHLHRVQAWTRRLACVPRSILRSAAAPGSVILWDVFGELNQTYALARAAFVGGSLARLGGQNFLEPLLQGTPACVGPHTRNFAWVGTEIFTALVTRSADLAVLADTLLGPVPERTTLRSAAMQYIASRRGATAASTALIRHHIARRDHV